MGVADTSIGAYFDCYPLHVSFNLVYAPLSFYPFISSSFHGNSWVVYTVEITIEITNHQIHIVLKRLENLDRFAQQYSLSIISIKYDTVCYLLFIICLKNQM